jgi:hypothetical protein
VAEPPELFRLKCASHHCPADANSTYFKRNNPLVCRVSARYNHGSTGRFTSHEGEFTITAPLINFQVTETQILLQAFLKLNVNLYKQCLKWQATQLAQVYSGRKINTRLRTSWRLTPYSAQSLVLLRRVTASWGWIPLHGPAKRNRSWPCRIIRGVLEGHTWKID